jgi:hypothetical protein
MLRSLRGRRTATHSRRQSKARYCAAGAAINGGGEEGVRLAAFDADEHALWQPSPGAVRPSCGGWLAWKYCSSLTCCWLAVLPMRPREKRA